jgi:hypothetical protein
MLVLAACSGDSSRESDPGTATTGAPSATSEPTGVPSKFYQWDDDVPERPGRLLCAAHARLMRWSAGGTIALKALRGEITAALQPVGQENAAGPST